MKYLPTFKLPLTQASFVLDHDTSSSSAATTDERTDPCSRPLCTYFGIGSREKKTKTGKNNSKNGNFKK